MPRILRLINRLNLGGPTFNAAYLTKYLAPEYETLLVAGMIDESEASSDFVLEEMELTPVYIPQMYRAVDPYKDWQAYQTLKQLIKDFQPDIVHTHAAKAGALGRMAACACRVPVIVHTFHGHVFHSYFSKWKSNIFVNIERYLARKSTCIIAISDKQKKELSEEFHLCPPEKITVVPLGFDLKRFTDDQSQKRSRFRNRHQVDDDEIVISIVGRLVPVKNHSLFLRALASVLTKTDQRIRAFLVGDGESRKEVEMLARALGLSVADSTQKPIARAQVTFTSWLREVDEVYAGSDIVALSSFNEGTPVSIIEAIASGKPVVTTDAGGISDIVTNVRNGFIVPNNNESAFSAALAELVQNRELRVTMGNADAQLIMSRFSYQRLIGDMKRLYERLLETNR
jgi:glycosyltransferase involved in cell wall biosynthesis